jgi:hypothetical protein
MFDFDHIEAWGPRLCRELSVAVPGDVSQAIARGKPILIEDARDILLSKVVVPENSIRRDSRGEAESAHHPMRCLRSSTCLQRL